MSDPKQVIVQVNGEERPFPQGTSLGDLLAIMDINRQRVAVEYNREIVKPAVWASTQIQDGDEIEVVHFVGGGR